MANPIAAALGPVGGLAACACCLLITAIWGLFATMIALAVYARRWKDAIDERTDLENGIINGNTNGVTALFSSHIILIGILCLYGYLGIRRSLRSAN